MMEHSGSHLESKKASFLSSFFTSGILPQQQKADWYIKEQIEIRGKTGKGRNGVTRCR